MPAWNSIHFKIESRVGTNNATPVRLARGNSDQHVVVVTPLSGMAKPTKLFCNRPSGTAAEYDPAPPDAWDHDFGSIDRSTPVNLCTASHTVKAGQTVGTAVLRVRELAVDDGLSPPRVHPVGMDTDINVA